MSTRRILAFVVTPAVLAGVVGFFGTQIAEYFRGERASGATMAHDELKDLRGYFQRLTENRPKTASEAMQQVEDLRRLIAIFTTELAREKAESLLADLQTAASELGTAERKQAEIQSQLLEKQAAKKRNDQAAMATAQRKADELQAGADVANGKARMALERAARFKTN